MSQLLKKYALLTACAALALCFTARSAHAQAAAATGEFGFEPMVAAGGSGEHLLFAYWSTANYTNTNININSPLGVTDTINKDKNVVYVRVRNSNTLPAGNVVTSFNICLLPGDSWTATLSMNGLMVMDEGGCDGDLRDLGTSSPAHMNLAMPPMAGEMAPLGDADSGYVEAWLRPVSALNDGADAAGTANFLPEHAYPRNISGTAMLVSPMSGFSSSYNATAITGCRIVDGNGETDATILADRTIDESVAALGAGFFVDTDAAADGTQANNMGCWFDPDGAATAMTSLLVTALNSEDKDLLTGRWTAISDDNVMSHTKVVVTFPMNHLNRADGSSDPVSVYVFDDKANMVIDDFQTTLSMGVNTCMFKPADMMGMDDMDDMDMMPMLSCNGTDVDSLGDAMAGGFRIFNNYVSNDPDDRVTELPDTLTPRETLAAIGLVFSYFEGTDGMMEYDQVTDLQWIDVDDAAHDRNTDGDLNSDDDATDPAVNANLSDLVHTQ